MSKYGPYGKLKWVPSTCPKCGEGRFDGTPIPLDVRDLLDRVYGRYFMPTLEEYPGFPGNPCWYAHCGKCWWKEMISGPNLFDFIKNKMDDAYRDPVSLVGPITEDK